MDNKKIITGFLVVAGAYLLYTQLYPKKKPCTCGDKKKQVVEAKSE